MLKRFSVFVALLASASAVRADEVAADDSVAQAAPAPAASAPVEAAPAADAVPAPVAAAPAPVDVPEVSGPAVASDPTDATPKYDDSQFVKGELSSLGGTKLQTKNTRVGVRAGLSKIGETFYVAGSAEFDLRLGKFQLGLAVPAQIPLYDPKLGLKGFLPEGLTLRKEDYSIPQNYVRVVRYLYYGRKEDNLYINVGTETSATIGHGAAVRRYVSNVDVNQAKLAAEVDFYGKYGGAELFVGDVLSPQSMVGAIGFIKPFGFSDLLALQRFSVGVTYDADLNAPWTLSRGPGNRQNLDKSPNPMPAVAETKKAEVIGLSIETKIVRSESVDIKPYLELSQLTGGGNGASLGFLGRFSFGDTTKHAFRLIGELRNFQGNYLPGYFDTFYGIQRYQYFTGKGDPTKDQTKLYDVLNRSPERIFGYYAELQYTMVDWIALSMAWEDSKARGGRNLVVHAELPATSMLRFFVSAHRRAVDGTLLEIGQDPISRQLKADNTLFIGGARIKILPILYLNLRAFRMWQVDTMSQGYRNVDGFQGDLEVGYEFARN